MKHDEMDKETRSKIMNKWKAWFGSFGDKIVDGGNPFADGAQAVTAGGVDAIPEDKWPAKGYTIINAEDMNEATEIAKGCPTFEDDSEGAVRVYEAMPM
ncbi:MAG: hypothetical protein KJI72_00310 [Patescibacteria group bacterium]|nr:hypothetical protein [Patescibacteria group bacterium]